MTGIVQSIKDQAPDVYWAAIDMAAAKDAKGQRVHSDRYIADQIMWRIEAHNELQAIRGGEIISVSF